MANQDPLRELLQNYNELNSPLITTLNEPPSALEFMRYVSLNRPFVVRGGAADWEATTTWNVASLKGVLKGRSVNVAVTAEGNADSPTKNEDGELLFVKPWEEQQDFGEFVDFVIAQEMEGRRKGEEKTTTSAPNTPPLFTSVPPSISFAHLALQTSPDAINLWIGNSHSTTALHKDNYENIYVQVIGKKHFVLLPPIVFPAVREKKLKSAKYVRRVGEEDGKWGLEIQIEEGEQEIPFPTWDPEGEDVDESYAEFVRPVRVTLEEGDMLYLPALWYHKVSQSCSEEGICCAVNYWYDMEFSGGFYSLCSFVRSVALARGVD